MEVADTRLYNIYFLKKWILFRFFQKKIGISKFYRIKTQNFEMSRQPFVEHVILHLYWSFCTVCFKFLF